MRPYIICHMVTSIDGKVTGDFLNRAECEKATEEYFRLNREISAQAFACGRRTMKESFTGDWYPDLKPFEGEVVDREDFIANADAERYAVAFDRRGKLGWQSSEIEDEDPGYGGAHIIEVLCESVPNAFLAYLRSIGVSYIFAGKYEMDLELALDKLCELFGISQMLLEGGSIINGVFERENLVDELSLVQAPVIAGAEGKTIFEDGVISDFTLKRVETLGGGVLWLRYVKG